MPKQTDKLKQNNNRVTTEPEQSLSDDSDAEQQPQKQIPAGASIYWDIPGDIPGLNRRRVPLPAEPALPEIPDASVTITSPDNTQAVKASEASLNVSAHQKIKPHASDEATFVQAVVQAVVLAVENKQPKLLAKLPATTTATSSTAFDSQPDADNLSAKPSAMSDVPATVPAIINRSASETETTTATTTATTADKTNSPEITSPTPASSTQKSATNAHTRPPVTPASDETKTSRAEHTYVSQPETDNKKTPAISRQVTPIKSNRVKSNTVKPSTVKSNRIKPSTEFLPPINEQPAQHNEKIRKHYVIPAMLALLLLLLLGGIGYEGKQKPEIVSTQPESPAPLNKPVELPALNTQPEAKVIEISVNKLDQYALSGIQMITHEVVKGDTLWDVAETYHSNPWRYPELAKRSKIKNPDLIYPGDVVHIHIKVTELASSIKGD